MVKKNTKKLKLKLPKKPDFNLGSIFKHIKSNWVDIAEIKKKLAAGKFDIKNHGIR